MEGEIDRNSQAISKSLQRFQARKLESFSLGFEIVPSINPLLFLIETANKNDRFHVAKFVVVNS